MSGPVLEAREPSARYLADVEPALLRGFEMFAMAPGGVAALRNLVLTLALQGRLVEQVLSDEPAIAFLRRIAEANDRDAPQPSGAYLPPGWCRVSFGDYASELNTGPFGSLIGKGDYLSGGVPLVNPSHMKAGRIVSEAQIAVSREMATQLSAYQLRAGDIVFARRGVVGRTALVTEREQGWLCGTGSFFARFEPEVNRSFLQLVFDSAAMRRYLAGVAVGATMVNLNQRVLRSAVFEVPPLAEQHRIVARVEELMKLCDALERSGRLAHEQHARLTSTLFDALAASESAHALVENWQRIAKHFDLLLDRPEAIAALEQTILQLAVRGLLVPQQVGDESAEKLLDRFRIDAGRDGSMRRGRSASAPAPVTGGELPFDVPTSWAWARFASVARVASDLVSPLQFQQARQVGPDCIEKATGRLLESRSVREAGVISANHRFRAGQILYSKIRPSLSKVAIVDFDGLCSADMYPIDTAMNSAYLQLFMLSAWFLDQVKVAENRVKMPKLNQEALGSFLVAVPPLAEQRRIVARVEELHRLFAQLRERLTAARHTQSLLADALVSQATS